MKNDRFPLILKSFWISLLYVGLGTISVLSVYPSSPLYGGWVLIALFITFPVTCISFGIMYSDNNAQATVLVVQAVVFCVFWIILFLWMKWKRNRNQNR